MSGPNNVLVPTLLSAEGSPTLLNLFQIELNFLWFLRPPAPCTLSCRKDSLLVH